MTNDGKAQEIREDYTKGGYRITIYAADLEDALKEMAEWKDKQFENKLRELLYKNFYIHPHDEGLICSENFDCKGDFDIFVDDFIKELNSIQL